MENKKKLTSSKEVNKKSETFLSLKNELLKSHPKELDTLVDEVIKKRELEDENLKKKIWSKQGVELPDQFIIREVDNDVDSSDIYENQLQLKCRNGYSLEYDRTECELEYHRVKGISDNGENINPDYMTDEDQIIEVKISKLVEMSVPVRVHKDTKSFNLDKFVFTGFIQGICWDLDSEWFKDRFEETEQRYEVVERRKLSGSPHKDEHNCYVYEDQMFFPPTEDTKPF